MSTSPKQTGVVRSIEDAKREEASARGPAEPRRMRRAGEEVQTAPMDAMGRLAGGIAHVFNNLLTAIACETELALARLALDDSARKHLREIEKVGARGAALARQLLAFSGRQALRPQVQQLNEVLTEMEDRLHRFVGDLVEVRVDLNPELDRVEVDREEMEQVILHIAANAREAMKEGGRFTIATSNVDVRPGNLTHPLRTSPGRYVLMTLSDTGPGMPEEVRSHVFEPFFTTKGGSSEMAGLGLSIAFGIVSQSGGHLLAESEEGKGSRFLIYLPSAEENALRFESNHEGERAEGRWETILLVDDEENVRNPLKEILETRGYRVLVAADAQQALRVSQDHAGPIHLMVTDILMGSKSGIELAEDLSYDRPEMKVLFATGYPASLTERPSLTDAEVPLLKKPFTGKDLAAKVREVLESGD
jgi:two-component system, cell cycle sensor histidine kinase and response regulator CckA